MTGGEGRGADGTVSRRPKEILPLCSGLTALLRVKAGGVPLGAYIQGRQVTEDTLREVRGLLEEHPRWHRTRLSRELCRRWRWQNDAGRLKDMACRTLLLKLEKRGWIRLPARRGPSPNGRRNRHRAELSLDESPLECALEELEPLQIEVVEPGSAGAEIFRALLQRHHYLGHRNCVGENLRYLVRARGGRPVACLLFGSAAWHCRARDEFIGWTASERQRRLPLLTNNTRFLVPAWVRVAHLASHLLAAATRRLSRDWQRKYGHPIRLVETFVQTDRFAGISYRAAGWQAVGLTRGRGRNAPGHEPSLPLKEVFLKALSAGFRRHLRA